MNTIGIVPFENCPALDGYHCQTNSLAKIYHHHGHPLSEDMLFGLGAGLGFIYWKMKMGDVTSVFTGGRGNNKDFFIDTGNRTGVKIDTITTTSAKKAEAVLLEKLKRKEPVMVFGDMGFLPWFDFPADYHFGGHTFVVCGYDGENTVLASDMDSQSGGLKKGFYAPVALDQLKKARNSDFKPFPPQNAYLEFNFNGFHPPEPEDIRRAIRQNTESMLNPPIKNMGVKGLVHTSGELIKWPTLFNDFDLRMNLFSMYIFIEVGGTGGGCFRYMYSRFLTESATVMKDDRLLPPSRKIWKSGELFSKTGLLFKDAEKADDLPNRLLAASPLFKEIALLEEDAFCEISGLV